MLLSQLFEESDILAKWTKSDNYHMASGLIANNFDDLVGEFPYGGGTLYRGLNFSSPKSYLQFKRSIRDGFVTSDSISSWSEDLNTAKGFALSPQVFVPTAAVIASYDSRERVSGFIGIILKITVKENIGIDVNASGEAVESEVILPPGSYKIEEIIPEKKWKHIVSKLDINQEVMDIVHGKKQIDMDQIYSLFRYKGKDLFENVKSELTNYSAKLFAESFKINLNKDEHKRFLSDKEHEILFPDGDMKLWLRGDGGFFDYVDYNDFIKYLDPVLLDKIKKSTIKKINDATKVINGKSVFIDYDNSFQFISKFFDIKLTDLKYLHKHYSDGYNRFNKLGQEWNKNRNFDMGRMAKVLAKFMKQPF